MERFQYGHSAWVTVLLIFIAWPIAGLGEETRTEAECELFLEALDYYQGNGVERNIPKAVELFEQAAQEEQHLDSMKMLVGIFSQGEDTEVDMEKAVTYIQMAAECGDADCQFALGQLLIGDKDPEKKKACVVWFERAAAQNHPQAQRVLGIFCSTGKYLPKDDQKAVFWFQKGAEQNDAFAQLMLGQALREGIGIPQDEKKAFSYLLKSARQGLAEAQYNVAACYINGIGVKRNTQKAEMWLRKSAAQGFPQAIQLMKKAGIPLPK